MVDATHATSPQTLSPWPIKASIVTTMVIMFLAFSVVLLPGSSQMFLPAAYFLPLLLLSFFFFFPLVNRRSSLPVNWPFLGMFPSILSNTQRIYDWGVDIVRPNGCNFMFKGPWFLGLDFLLVADAANVNHIFNLRHANYPKGDEFSEMFDILGGGIFNATGDLWRYQRKKAYAMMSSEGFRSAVASSSRDKVEKGLLPLMSHLACRREAVDLQDVFLRFTFDITCITVLGVDPGCLSADFQIIPFSKAVDESEEAVFFRHIVPGVWWKLLRWLGAGQEKRLAEGRVVIDQYMAECISQLREDRKRGDEKEAHPVSLLSSFLDDDPSVVDGKGIAIGSDTMLRDVGFSFLVAGRDTTASALTWFFFMLSQHPHVEAKILEELSGLAPCKKEGGLAMFDAEELASLVYLHAALCETLRLFPSVPLNHRSALQENVLPSGHRVGPGTRIIISLHAMARMEEVWGKDCEQFRPERWISEKGKLRHEPSYKFIAFSSGTRNCLGKDTAFTQMKVAVAAMLYNFEIEVVDGHVVQPKVSLVLLIKNGLMVNLRKRRGAGVSGSDM